MNIKDFLPSYPLIPSSDFYSKLVEKKEFNELKLATSEPFPEIRGQLLKHQQFIQRFMSNKTVYDRLILVHSMGTGKSCSVVGAIEAIKNDPSSVFDGAIIVAKSKPMLDNFKREIVYKCTDGRYITNNKMDSRQLNKSLKHFYDFSTIYTFAKNIGNYSDDYLRKEYENKIIVVDEVHNIRKAEEEAVKEKKEKINVYQNLLRLFTVLKNSKIILLTGTPMISSGYLLKYHNLLIYPFRIKLFIYHNI